MDAAAEDDAAEDEAAMDDAPDPTGDLGCSTPRRRGRTRSGRSPRSPRSIPSRRSCRSRPSPRGHRHPSAHDPETVDGAEDGYGHLWESTVLRTVEDAAIRIEEVDESEAQPALPSHRRRRTSTPPVGCPAPILEAGDSSMIDGIPANGPVRRPPRRCVQPRSAQTPNRRRPTLPSRSREQAPIRRRTTTTGTRCSRRSSRISGPRWRAAARSRRPRSAGLHARGRPDLRPARGTRRAADPCPGVLRGAREPTLTRRLRMVLGPAPGDAHLVTRPSLGRLTLSNGQVVELDRPVVLGRRPRTTRAQSNDLPRLVAVPSPEQDISRSHVEIQLEGWHVLVCDLNTTNGTTLHRPGQPPRRLHPGSPRWSRRRTSSTSVTA
ncbi:FHA domain-containing protein [Oerskovia sp. M15]